MYEIRVSRIQNYPAFCICSRKKNFGNWKIALEFAEINYDKDVLRKPAELTLLEIIKSFDTWDKSHNGKWIITDIREKNNKLERALRNTFINKRRDIPFTKIHKNQIFTCWVCLKYWRLFGEIRDDINWFEKNKIQLKDEFKNNHEGQNRWEENDIISQIHQLYSEGPNKLRLTRESIKNSSKKEYKTLWAAMRQNRFRKSGKNENDWLKSAGFIPEKLQSLYKELDEPYSIKELAKFFSTQMTESISNQENRLSREWVSYNYHQIHNHLINRFKSWEKALTYFGLDPKFFQITATKRTKRGYQFQVFFQEILLKYGFKQVNSNPKENEFVSNKLLISCQHKPKCKPDFLFANMIIDTKTGYHISQKPEQLLRYKEHSLKIIVLTIRGQKRTEYIDDKAIEVIGFSDFIKESKKVLGIQLDKKENGELTKILKRNPFWT